VDTDYTGSKEETGSGLGESFNFNFPLPKGTTDGKYHSALEAVIGAIKNFDPYYVVVRFVA
jgi:acetoin utilization deacetylase AcuC-like enzyme